MLPNLIKLCSGQWITQRIYLHLFAALFGIAFPLPPLTLYTLVVGSCYSIAYFQSCRLILLPSFFFLIPLFQWFSLLILFYYSIFDRLPLNVFQCDWCPCLYCLLFIFFIHSLGWGLMAGLWILLATGVVPSDRGWVAGQP